MKKITLFIVLALSVAMVSAGTDAKKSSGTNTKSGACCASKTGAAPNAATETTHADVNKALCPTVAAGKTCAHPEKCSFSHETASQCTCKQQSEKSWYKFWGKSEKCDHCSSKNT